MLKRKFVQGKPWKNRARFFWVIAEGGGTGL